MKIDPSKIYFLMANSAFWKSQEFTSKKPRVRYYKENIGICKIKFSLEFYYI